MRTPKSIFILIFTILPLFVNAQGLSISGTINDSRNKRGLEAANVVLLGANNYTSTSNKQGNFEFTGVTAGDYELQVSFIGYTSTTKKLNTVTTNLNLNNIYLQRERKEIDEVVVEQKIQLATISGDSILYNADAYKTNPDADAEDLIKKMPGITVEDGTVEAQGEQVKRVLVDGKPFFDQDPTLALRSIPAEVIQKIEVFDEMSDQAKFTGFDDGESTKVMNIVTRSNMKNGQFGKLYIGGGLPDKYQLGGNVNIFNGDRRISIIGQSNNVNQQNFSSEDLLGVVGSSGGRRGGFSGGKGGGGGRPGGGGSGRPPGGGGSSSQDFMVGQQAGISTTHALGINYSDKWGDKINVSGSYFFNQSENNQEQDIYQKYFSDSEDYNQYYTEDNTSVSTNMNHRFTFKFDYDVNDNNKIMIRPRFSFQGNEGVSEILGISAVNDSVLNQNENYLSTDMQGFNFSNQFLWMHKFDKKGRTISLSADISAASKKSESYQMSKNIAQENELPTDSLNQYTDYDNPTNGFGVRAVYTEPLGESSQLMLNAHSKYTFDDGDREVFNYDYDTETYTDLDTNLSNVFKSSYATHRMGTGYRYNKNRNMLMIGLDYQYSTLNSNQEYPEVYDLDKSFHSVLPQIRFRYNISRTKNLMFNYMSYTQQPSVSQLQNTIDNSSPLQLTMGNPDLNESNNNRIMARYTSSNVDKASIFFVMASAQYTKNYIANNTLFALQDTLINNSILLQQGGTLIKPINMDNYFNARLLTTYGFPITPIKSNLNASLSYTYSHTPGVYNDESIYSDNNLVGAGLTLSSNISENVDFTISSNSNYNRATSSLQSSLNNNYFNQKTQASLSLIFPKGIVLRSSLAHQYYYWEDSDMSDSYSLLNLELGKKFMKDQAAEIKLSVFDALQQNNNISRNVTEAYVEDITSNALQRYVMLSFAYRLRNFRIN